MTNLIFNSCWFPGPDGEPEFFSGLGTTYDDFSQNGYRTCSITQSAESGVTGFNRYDPAIEVTGRRSIQWGYFIRAIDAQDVTLRADFYSEIGDLITTTKQPIQDRITSQFTQQMACFRVPADATTVQLSIEFSGKITACTFYAPLAYFC